MPEPATPSRPPWPRGRSRHGGIDEVPLASSIATDGAGRLWLCGKHAVGPDPEAVLAEIAATTIVCLTERFELADRYPAYVEWLDAHRGGRAVWYPVPDLHAPAAAQVVPLLDGLRGRLLGGESLLIHCAAGIGRSGTIAVCLLITMGLSADDALRHVAAHRPMAGPEAGPQVDLVDAISRFVTGPGPACSS